VVKKETLKLAHLRLDENVLIYTISSAESDIRVCGIINKIFNIGLSLTDDLVVTIKSSTVNFRRYQHESDEGIEKYMFLVNHSQGYYLLPELKKIDYIFLILTESLTLDINAPLEQLRINPGISAVFSLDPSSLKSFSRIKF
jgi:hypothetical protein